MRSTMRIARFAISRKQLPDTVTGLLSSGNVNTLMTLKTFFSGGQLNRAAEFRNDPEFLLRAWQNPAARYLAIWQSRCMVEQDTLVLLQQHQLGGDWSVEDSIYLGQ